MSYPMRGCLLKYVTETKRKDRNCVAGMVRTEYNEDLKRNLIYKNIDSSERESCMYKLTEELSAVFNVDLPCHRQPSSNFESYNEERCWLIKECGCP